MQIADRTPKLGRSTKDPDVYNWSVLGKAGKSEFPAKGSTFHAFQRE